MPAVRENNLLFLIGAKSTLEVNDERLKKGKCEDNFNPTIPMTITMNLTSSGVLSLLDQIAN